MSQTQVRREIVLDAARDEVWDALTDPFLLAQWLAEDVNGFEPEPGAEAVFVYDDGERREAVVERVEDGESITLRWWRADGIESRVELEITDAVAGTRLTVVETPVAARTWAPAASARAEVAWTRAVTALRTLLSLQPAPVAV